MSAPVLDAPVDPYTYQPDQQPPDGLSPAEEAVVAALTAYFASRAAVAATTLPAALVARLASLRLSPRAVRAAGRLTIEPPLTGRNRWGSPTPKSGPQAMTRRMAAHEPTYRAMYLLAASKRLTQALRDREFTRGLAQEKAYLDAHRRAAQRRAQAAREYDRVARWHAFLKWITAGDDRVDPECRQREGSVWHVDSPPWPVPGAVHARCRCRAIPVD